MKEAEHLCWFYSVWWEEQKRQVDCLVDLSISNISALNNGFWLIRDENGFVLKQAGKVDLGDVLGIAKHWSVEIELASEEF